MAHDRADVVVIGGGLSGLAAARQLIGTGVEDVIVLEARSLPGGRCTLGVVGGITVDIGPMFVGRTQTRIAQLAADFGLEPFAVHAGGTTARLINGAVRYGAEAEAELSTAQQEELQCGIAEFDRLCATVDPGQPWAAPDAESLDMLTFESWIRGQSNDPEVQAALARQWLSIGATTSQLSMLALLVFIGSAGARTGHEGEFDEVFEGGVGQIPLRMAEDLGDRIRLGWPVSAISWSGDGAEINGPGGSLRAQRVIAAMSPSDAGRIRFHPTLTTPREVLHRSWFATGVLKTMVVYERPFWREPSNGRPALAGTASNDSGGPHIVMDITPPEASYGLLMMSTRLFGEGQRFGVAPAILDDPVARRALLLGNLVKLFGEEAAHPRDLLETNWHAEPYISGCMTYPNPGVLTQCREALRQPVGPIHWAGTETAHSWMNHMEGAVQAGQRAADEVAVALAAAYV